jgi:beta-N-acetylhexosaminidase
MCDDIGMKALSGSMEARARSVLAAGCDVVLHCSGALKEMEAVAAATPVLSGDAARRYAAALARLDAPKPFDETRAENLLSEILAEIA